MRLRGAAAPGLVVFYTIARTSGLSRYLPDCGWDELAVPGRCRSYHLPRPYIDAVACSGDGLRERPATMRPRRAVEEGMPLHVSDLSIDPPGMKVQSPSAMTAPEDERPPLCPKCNKRLVILSTQAARDESGMPIRQQLWGCPRGHATAIRRAGSFLPVEVLAELVG